MDSELDLRTLLRSALTYWRAILVAMLITGMVAALSTLLVARPARASADVLILPDSEQINLDPRYTSRDATLLTTSSLQRQALIALASSSTVEARVAEELINEGQLNTYIPGMLLSQISIEAQGDLVKVIAANEDSEIALRLATVWGQSYERLVSEVYSRDNGSNSQIDAQVTSARQHYEDAQKNLEQFLTTSNRVAVEQQILRVSGLLDSSRSSGTLLYTQYLTRVQELDLILADANVLREQSASGASSDLSNSLSVLALRARVAGGVTLPVQLRFDDPGTLASSEGATLRELDNLIAVLKDERERMLEASRKLAEDLAAGDESNAGLTPDVRESYERELTELTSQRETLNGQEAALIQQRDIALSSLELLLRKSDEERIAKTVSQVGVRVVSVGPIPPSSLVLRLAINMFLGLFVGLTVGGVYALIRALRQQRLSPKIQPGDISIDRPAPTL